MTKNLVFSALVALAISFVVTVGNNQSNFSGLSERDIKAVSLTVGDNGTKINELKATTCNLSTTQLPLEATSTDVFYCAVTGVASGDLVWVQLPSDNGQVGLSTGGGVGFQTTYAVASSTAGYIEVGIGNLTGAASSTFPLATTSVRVFYFDN